MRPPKLDHLICPRKQQRRHFAALAAKMALGVPGDLSALLLG
jgi:hypothetical protein